jgi:hypothetical protein
LMVGIACCGIGNGVPVAPSQKELSAKRFELPSADS